VQKLESIHSACCLVNPVYPEYPQEDHSPSECLASYRSLQKQLRVVPNCMILVPLSGLTESTKLILTGNSNESCEDLSLEIFFCQSGKGTECSYGINVLLCYQMPNFYNMKKMTFLEIPPNYCSFIYYTTYEYGNPGVLQLPSDPFF